MKNATLLCAVLLCTLAGTCDHTVLRGKIQADRTDVAVGEKVRLELSVPGEFEGIHRVSWEVAPREGATLEAFEYDYDHAEQKKDRPARYGRKDRVAWFTGNRPGTYEISAYGYYKQTNVQPITRVKIRVR